MSKKFLIVLIFILMILLVVANFKYEILYFMLEKNYNKKYSNIYKVQENLSYNSETHLTESKPVSVNDLNITFSDFEYSENNLRFNLKFSHSKPLNYAGYILRIYNKDYYLERHFGNSSFSSAFEYIINRNQFFKTTFNYISSSKGVFGEELDENPYILPYYCSNAVIQNELLEDGSVLHNISVDFSENFVIEDSLYIELFDLNYQNIGDKNFYIPEEPLTQVDYTINININSNK